LVYGYGITFAGGAKGPDLAGVKIPTAKCAAAITAVRTADQNPSRFALIMPEFPLHDCGVGIRAT